MAQETVGPTKTGYFFACLFLDWKLDIFSFYLLTVTD
jgi:hypothetical protein